MSPKIIYKNSAGKRLPSVTTILGQLGWSREGLMYWSWSLGCEGIDYRDARKAAADVGTYSHSAIEADIKGEAFDLDELPISDEDKGYVAEAWEAYRGWAAQTSLEPVAAEVSLVSEKLQFGGTMDVVALQPRKDSDKQTCILDLKTGGGPYPDHLLQIAAYGMLWNESHPDRPIEAYHLLRVGKTDGSFHHHMWPAPRMRIAQQAFQLTREIYTLHATLKKMV